MFARLLKEVARRDEIIKHHLDDYKVSSAELMLSFWEFNFFSPWFVQLKGKKNEHAITGSLLQALDKHHTTEHEEVSALNTRVVWNLTILLQSLTHLVLSSHSQMFMSTWPLWTFSSGEQRPRQPGWTGPWPSCCTDQRSLFICRT